MSSATSLFDLYKIGIGPSSSHTMGPMRAAGRFADELVAAGHLPQVARVQVDLYGSLALTGKGHCTDRGVLLGLMGYRPDTVPPLALCSRSRRALSQLFNMTMACSNTTVSRSLTVRQWSGTSPPATSSL